jgi:hypothetical protein
LTKESNRNSVQPSTFTSHSINDSCNLYIIFYCAFPSLLQCKQITKLQTFSCTRASRVVSLHTTVTCKAPCFCFSIGYFQIQG